MDAAIEGESARAEGPSWLLKALDNDNYLPGCSLDSHLFVAKIDAIRYSVSCCIVLLRT